MATTVRFRDHEEFQRTALHMGIAGVLTGLGVFGASLVVPGFGAIGGAWAMAGLMAAAAFGAARPERRAGVLDLGLLGAVTIGVGVTLSVAQVSPRLEGLGAGALAAGFGLLVARGGRRFLATLVGAAAVALLCRFVYMNLLSAADAAHVPTWITAGVTGGAFAFVGVLGVLPRHVDIAYDRIADAHASCQGVVTGEIRELADRAVALWNKVDATLEPDAPVRKAIEDSVVRLFDVARRWSAVEADGARTPVDLLAQRMAVITEKMDKTSDAIAKQQYAQAHAALAEQVGYLKEIGTARERVVARMHHYLAAMERLRFAVINHRSADASRLSSEVQPILDDLKDLGSEIDFSREAMTEVEPA